MMYIIHKVVICLILICSFVIVYLFDVKLNESFFNAILAFSGIIFGFLISSISTLFGSRYMKYLNRVEDIKTSRMQTQLQTLKAYYLEAIHFCLAMALLSLGSNFFSPSLLINSVLCSLFNITIFIVWLLVRLLLKGLEEETKIKNKMDEDND